MNSVKAFLFGIAVVGVLTQCYLLCSEDPVGTKENVIIPPRFYRV